MAVSRGGKKIKNSLTVSTPRRVENVHMLPPDSGPHATRWSAFSTSNWSAYVDELYDPTVDDTQEPEICKILGEKTEASTNIPERELKDAASQRFAVCKPCHVDVPLWPLS